MELQHNNRTVQFFLVGFSDSPDFGIPLFIFFIFTYMLTLAGNFILLLLILVSPSLNTPMYLFLCNLSALDIVYPTVTCPKLLYIFATNDGRISFVQCILQLFFFIAFWNIEYLLLTVMSYDRYLAVCRPLHYTMIMNGRMCTITAIGTWLTGILGSISPTTVTSMASYHPSTNLNHFFCDIKVLETVAIDENANIHNVILIHGLLFVMTSFMLTLISYAYIAVSICKIRSNKGKYKAFSTCASHLTTVSCFYILIFNLYFKPKSTILENYGKVLTVFIVYIIPLLNPVLYSFRNKDVKEALAKVFLARNLDIGDNSTEFFIVGFSDVPDAQIQLFLFFLFVYILTLIGNLVLVLLICISPSLNTPMYFFLCNLSSLEILYTSVTCPKLIHIFATMDGSISFLGCMVQLYFFTAFWHIEYFLLTVMSYDRYVAICKPLHYTMIMNRRGCTIAATGTWLGGMLASFSPTTAASMTTYHSYNRINHFFCDIKALEVIAVTTNIHIVIFINGTLLVVTSLIFILISYIFIGESIMRIKSNKGKYKAFSTCASHLTVVSCFYILMFLLYFRPKSDISLKQNKVLTVLFVYLIPLLNPVVYSFRNKDVKDALRNVLKTLCTH